MKLAPFAALVLVMSACHTGWAQSTPTLLDRFDLSERAGRFELPGGLDEVSGLTFTTDGRLFAHDDERARIVELDWRRGVSVKRFRMGERTARDDFEGVAMVGDRLFLVSSRGFLYESREGADDEEMVFRVTDTGLGARCEVEGLEYLPPADELLLACKTTAPERDVVVVHRLPIDPGATRPPAIEIRRDELTRWGVPTDFHPSGLAWDAAAGTLLLVAAREEALIEVTLEGRVLSGTRLQRDRHPQTEGIAIGPQGDLFLADEKNGKPARLTWYPRRPPGDAP